ncbi:MAG: tRNA (N6-isopentenyl adenosine(37)-C2)-methylthiotransferase MiaB [Erysipelotrichaceae bacterium]|nr:tRNA (N6-isopentenyl adenosine(37)-C2)-methylthiotransferase MiaB [Erysipelotrichaceae bacterium]
MKKDYKLPDLKLASNRTGETKKVIFEISDEYKTLGADKKYFIKTHGCQANQRDSESIAGLLEDMSYSPAKDETEADLVLINTCAVREGAEDKVFGEIGALKRLKREKPSMLIGICGCMAQEEKTVEEILSKYHQVDIIFGTHNITSLPKLINDVLTANKKRAVEVYSKQGEVIEEVPVTRFASHKAWVNIMYGCDNFCTYCIVPYTRGKERSRLLEDVVKEVKQLKEEGYVEICLLGQNVNDYGRDLKLGYDFADLLDEVAKTGIRRIRFVTSNPWGFTDKMIDCLARNENVCPYLHLPVQSGSNDVLKLMNRHYTKESYKELFDKIKKAVPHYAFTTDIIVGFPNETDEDFKDTLDMVDYCKYDNAFTFIYSKRSGTPAARMEDLTPREVKEARLQELNQHVAKWANESMQKFKGQTVEVLVDGISKKNANAYSGYTVENKLVNFTGDDVKVGDLVMVEIEEAMSFSLKGKMVSKVEL